MPKDQVMNPTLMRLQDIEARLTRLEQQMSIDLPPAQYAASVGLPPETLERAAEAINLAKYRLSSTEGQLMTALRILAPAIEKPLRDQIARLQATIRWYDDGENSDAAIELMCWETLRRGDMAAAEGGAE
jgi:hypothetical protein